MVEALLEGSTRTATPTFVGRDHTGPGPVVAKVSPSLRPSQANSDFHDSKVLIIPTFPDWIGQVGRDTSDTTTPDSMQGDASNRGTPVRDRPRPSNRHRHPHSTIAPRSSTSQPIPPSPHGYFVPPLAAPGNEIRHSQIPPAVVFQGAALHYTPQAQPYNQRGGFLGQYTVPNQPSSVNMGQSPAAFVYPHTFQSTAAPDNSMTPQNMTPSYHPMVPPHTPLYPYRHHSPDDGSTSTYPGSSHSPPFASHSTSPNINPTLSSAVAPTGPISPPYMGPGHYQGLGYPSPALPPQYGYQQQFPTPPPMYQPYPSMHYSQHPSSPLEVDQQNQGTWYYFPHNAPPPHQQQQFEGPHYPPVHPIPYRPVARREDTPGYFPAPLSTSSSSLFNRYPLQSTQSGVEVPPERLSPHLPPIVRSAPPSNAEAGTSSSSARSADAKPTVRRPWHPKAPAHRSPWVMWVGNVPSDANHEELWKFFTQELEGSPMEDTENAGVDSIFLISRSNCAFINYNTEESLKAAIARSNGVALRSSDPRCPKLVCRARRTDEDLKSGVGGQRGMGLHVQWVKEQKMKNRARSREPSELSTSDDPSASPQSASERLANALVSVSITSNEEGRGPMKAKHSSSSGSYASTTSSFLFEHYPKRYFILKSLTQYDLDLSLQSGLWATQKHNEGILDQAFRTAKDVYLIFSVNKSGEFYGYARMVGPIRRGEGTVPWAARLNTSASPSSQPSERSIEQQSGESDSVSAAPKSTPVAFFSPGSSRLVENSPMPVDEGAEPDVLVKASDSDRQHQSAPPDFAGLRDRAERTPSLKFSLDHHERATMKRQQGDQFELDPAAPVRALRAHQGPSSSKEMDGTGSNPVSNLQLVEEAEEVPEEAPIEDPGTRESVWGDCFRLEWLSTQKVPFHRTRHLRNPWNKGREVKISRDGTEVEPNLGKRLLEEWEGLAEHSLPASMGAGIPPGGVSRRTAPRVSPIAGPSKS